MNVATEQNGLLFRGFEVTILDGNQATLELNHTQRLHTGSGYYDILAVNGIGTSAVIPEPSTYALLGIGLLFFGTASIIRRKNSNHRNVQ